MLKITGRTSHQLDALEREGLPTDRRTASTVTLPSFTTWAEFAAWTTETRARAKAGTSFYYESGKLATEAADLSDGDPARRERVEKSLRRGHLTALASLDRYAQEQASIERETPDAKTRNFTELVDRGTSILYLYGHEEEREHLPPPRRPR